MRNALVFIGLGMAASMGFRVGSAIAQGKGPPAAHQGKQAPSPGKSSPNAHGKAQPSSAEKPAPGKAAYHQSIPEPATITVSNERWRQVNNDLTLAIERIVSLQGETEQLRRDLDRLRKRPGCSE